MCVSLCYHGNIFTSQLSKCLFDFRDLYLINFRFFFSSDFVFLLIMTRSKILRNNYKTKYLKTKTRAKSFCSSMNLSKKSHQQKTPNARTERPPRSPFINFFREYRSKHPTMSIVQMATTVSKRWNDMSTKEKKMYISSKHAKWSTIRSNLTRTRKKSPKRVRCISSARSERTKSQISDTESLSETPCSGTSSAHKDL